jgi:hypothetical protein
MDGMTWTEFFQCDRCHIERYETTGVAGDYDVFLTVERLN